MSRMEWWSGLEAAARAPWLWASMEARYRPYALWDMPEAQKPDMLANGLANSLEAACFFGPSGLPELFVFVLPLSRGGACGMAHLTFLRDCGERAYDHARQYFLGSRLKKVLGLIPGPFRQARQFAMDCGFYLVDILPDACWLEHWQRRCDGLLYDCLIDAMRMQCLQNLPPMRGRRQYLQDRLQQAGLTGAQ